MLVIIAGIERTSLVDWPEKICSTIFIAGCNFRCPFCHNSELVLPEKIENIEAMTENELLTALVERKRFIDGVCITGGEPLMSPDIVKLIHKMKDKGFAVKLDTNGSVPTLLKKIIDEKLVDYVAMDIKAPKERYGEATGINANTKLIEESIKILKESSIDHEFRTTVVKGLLAKEDIIAIGEWIKGAKAYYLQQFMSTEKTLSPEYHKKQSYTPEELGEMLDAVKKNFKKTGIRGV
ncbi:anaerobic ribonucleoside-triphosphate reductase activating protein [Candidatus Woesearchaeota archaeon]|nr:anaerobic ribonucleoside-triphosphate reductase activating protein [Candidatus Woesearchaeota archaeon]